jgi:hypothetical protein
MATAPTKRERLIIITKRREEKIFPKTWGVIRRGYSSSK